VRALINAIVLLNTRYPRVNSDMTLHNGTKCQMVLYWNLLIFSMLGYVIPYAIIYQEITQLKIL